MEDHSESKRQKLSEDNLEKQKWRQKELRDEVIAFDNEADLKLFDQNCYGHYFDKQEMETWYYDKILISLIRICSHIMPQVECEVTKHEVNNCLQKLTQLKNKIDELLSDCNSQNVRMQAPQKVQIFHKMFATNRTILVDSTVFLFGPNLEMQLRACKFMPSELANFLKFVENCVNFYDANTHAKTHAKTHAPSFSLFATLEHIRFPPTANFSHRILELQHKMCEDNDDKLFSTVILLKLHTGARLLIDSTYGNRLTLQALANSAYSDEEQKTFVDEKDELLRRLQTQHDEAADSNHAIANFWNPQTGRVVAEAMSFMLTHVHLIDAFKLEHALVQLLQTFLFSGWLQERQMLASDDMQLCQDLQRKIHEFITIHIEKMDNHTMCEKLCANFFNQVERLEIKAV